MNDRFKNAFDKIQAEEQLKDRTRAFIYKKTKGYTRGKTAAYLRLIPAAACFLLIILGGCLLYFIPTVEISIDVNPSIELGVNRFDKIISVSSYNSDGQELAASLDIKYLDCAEAVNRILTNENVSELLSNDEVMTICVVGSDDKQSDRVLSEIESCTAGEANTYCYYANSDEVSEAHNIGLSYGKYRAYLELRSLDPTITVQKVQDMTMRQIRELIDSLSDDSSSAADSEDDNEDEHIGNGTGNMYGQEQNQGQNQTQGQGQGHGQGNSQGHGQGNSQGKGQGQN